MLTREEALKKHREMWTAMQKELGDNPRFSDRERFKENYCMEHEGHSIVCNCYLCQYRNEHRLSCDECPIDWGRGCAIGSTRYDISPISEILALPEREVPNEDQS